MPSTHAPARSPRPRPLFRLLLALLAGLPLSAPLAAHGGVYRGPGSGIPAGGAPTPGAPPATGAPGTGASTDSGEWGAWWGFNRAGWLDLKRHVGAAAVETGDDEFFAGANEKRSRPGPLPSDEDVAGRVVPALVRALKRGRGDDLRSGALIALGRIGIAPEGGFPALFTPLLADPSQEIAESAALALGIGGEPSCTTTLAELLAGGEGARKLVGEREVPYRTRAFAAYGLGLAGAATTMQDLRRYATLHLLSALATDDSSARDVRVACVLSLGLCAGPGGSGAREALEALLADPRADELVRAHAPVALARQLVDAPAPARVELAERLCKLAAAAKSPTALRQGAVQALGRLADADGDAPDRETRRVLRGLLGEGDRQVRALALIALAEIGARPGGGEEPEAAAGEVRALLLERLARGPTLLRGWSAMALGVLEGRRVQAGARPSGDVQQALRSAYAEERGPLEEGALALALGLARDLDSREALLARATAEGDDGARGYACLALGLLGERSAREPLRAIVRGARFRPSLLQDAAIALGMLEDPQVVPLLLEMLDASSSLAATAAIATALGQVGDRRAVLPLVERLDDLERNERVHAFCAVALGTLCDRRPVPWNAELGRDVTWWLAPPTLVDPVSGKGVLDLL